MDDSNQRSNDRLANATPPRHPDYADVSERLRSYARWTHRRPDPTALANAGFFFTNDGDLVRCNQCGIGLKDFSEEDNALIEHVRYSGSCPYLLEYLGADRLAEIRRQLQFQDPEFNRRVQWSERHRHNPANATYRHPEYQTLQARLSSFTGWPQYMTQTPQQLADAGLYYTGFDDRVRCFACDGGLRRWDPEDDPWTEHCRWFPACPFARTQKGDDYIALIQASVTSESQEKFGGNGLSAALERMEIRDPALQAVLNELKDTCLEIGYQLEDFNEAVKELRERGRGQTSIEEIIDVIEVIKARRTQDEVLLSIVDETPAEENRRLKNIVKCMTCGKNETNCLFLPCTHHRLCMECAAPLTNCPVCDKNIRQKIRTFMENFGGDGLSALQAALNELRDACLEMEYQLEDFNEAELREREIPIQRRMPMCLKYKTMEARLSSFELWPIQIKQNREEMAGAGLYYTGSNDMVRCFYCGGKLRCWQANDDVWTEHARLFPLCPYVRNKKGSAFITHVQKTDNEDCELYDSGGSLKHFNALKAEILRMGFSQTDDLLYAYRHLKNTSNSEPTLDEMVEALCQLNN